MEVSRFSTTFIQLPITALEPLQLPDQLILLVAQGSYLSIYDSHEGSLLHRRRVFPAGVIRGIASISYCPNTATDSAKAGPGLQCRVRLLIWAGLICCVAEVRFNCASRGSRRVWDHEWQFADYIHLPDAILAASFANNHRIAYILNSHGDLWQVSIRSAHHCKELLVSTGERTALLYSAHIKYISGQIIVATGSAFGDITVWSIDAATAAIGYCEKRFHDLCKTGSNGDHQSHNGAIFGLQISNEISANGKKIIFLVSCSDDWTIRTWTLDANLQRLGAQQVPSLSSTKLPPSQVGHHGSRVWSVRFVERSSTDETRPYTNMSLVSVGENLQCRQWLLRALDGDELLPLAIDKVHKGKHVWSVVQGRSEDKERDLFTGGADGAVVSRSARWPNGEAQSLQQSLPITQILPDPGPDLSRQVPPRGRPSITQLLFFDCEFLLALMDSGVLVQGLVTRILEKVLVVRWSVPCAFLGHKIVAISKMPMVRKPGSFAYVADENSNIFELETSLGEWISRSFVVKLEMRVSSISALGDGGINRCLMVYSSDRKMAAYLQWHNFPYQVEKQNLELPFGFTCSGAALQHKGRVLVLGSRQGSLAIYQRGAQWNLRTCIRHVHGKESVTSLSPIPSTVRSPFPSFSPSEDEIPDLFISTGRDGCCVTHRLGDGEDINGVVDASTSPFLGGFEGAFYTYMEGPLNSPALIYYGFREYDFVIWNQTSQLEVARISCGGAHRTWSFNPVDFSFAWTKGGNFNLYDFTKPLYASLQVGGHGREIKALAVSRPTIPSQRSSIAGRKVLIATGAEDTTIRLLNAPLDSAEDGLTCFKILSAHTTGIQHLAFSSGGQKLFSSGGCEELFIWSIQYDVPSIGIGVRLEFIFPKGSPDQSDLRITTFQVQDEGKTSGADVPRPKFTIVAVYSNSMIKFLQYESTQQGGKGTSTVLKQLFYHENCITQIYCRRHVLTGSTDGRVALWDIPDMANGGSPITTQQVHQNSITAMKVVPVRSGKPEIDLVITGGDDNALGLSLRHHVDEPYFATRLPVFEVLFLPDAHAAAITAICMVHCSRELRDVVVHFLTAGNDQIVKFWKITLQFQPGVNRPRWTNPESPADTIQVEKLAEAKTQVADVAGMELIGGPSYGRGESFRALVVGVGMEILRYGNLR